MILRRTDWQSVLQRANRFPGGNPVILAAGLTPAWQQVLVFDSFRYGEVNRAREVHWCASGKVFNAGIALHLLGGPSMTLAPVGGLNLVPIEREFKGKNIEHRWVVTKAATRVCTTIIDRVKREDHRAGRKRPAAYGGGTRRVPQSLRRRGRQGRGGDPHRLAARRHAGVLLPRAGRADAVSGDPRFPRRGAPSVPRPAAAGGQAEPRGAGPNRRPAAGQTDEDLLDAMRSLNRRGAQWVVITQGSRPVWVTSADAAYRLHPLPVETVVNPIGCGDVMTAAIAWSIRSGRDMLDSLRVGMAAAHANLCNVLPGRFDPKEIDALAGRVSLEEVALG